MTPPRTPRLPVAAASLLTLASLLATTPARAQAAPGASGDPDAVPEDLPRLVLDTGRAPVPRPEPDLVRLQIHGEYQIRYTHLRSFLLDPTESVVAAHPGAIADSLGQNDYARHWLRLTPRLQVKDDVEVIGQIDLLTGLVLGDLAHDTFADETPRDEYDGFKNVQLRWLYLDWLTKYGLWRVGQQPSHWGMGIVANDGDHPPLFGDYRYGAITDAVLFATKPMGKDGPLTVAAAGQLVYRDQNARLTRGDNALQAVLAGYWERGPNQVGIYGVYRHQTTNRTSGSDLTPYPENIDAFVVDAAGKFATRVPGADAWLFGAAEAAVILGSTNAERTQDTSLTGARTTLRAYGGAAQLGVVHRASEAAKAAPQAAPITWGAGWRRSRSATRPATPIRTTARRSASCSIRTTKWGCCCSTR